MPLKIEQDHARFKAIVRGRIKQNLRKFIQRGELIGKRGGQAVTIPLPTIDIPRFQYGHRDQGGVGQGDGEVGSVLGPGAVEPGSGEAGQGEGEHALEVEVSLEELASILGEELELPRIQPKGHDHVVATKTRYTGINTTGPESLRHFKRTYKRALRRQIASGTYNPAAPVIVPTHEDRRYRSWRLQPIPENNAAILYMMDVSGSMGDEQKEIVRIESFWIDTWLRSQYQGIECRYLIHDAVAREVDRETFFHTRESGGTMISSAYKLCQEIIDAEYSPSAWNVYALHFSDGDNWSADDTRLCLDILAKRMLPAVNLFGYGQVESPYGSGQFIKDLREGVGGDEKVSLSEIADKEAIYGSIRDFLGKGR